MRKYILISSLSIIGLTILILIYLSIYGFKTSKFNDYINEEVKKINSKISLNINDVFLKLNLSEQSIKISTKNTKVYIDNDFLDLSDININLDLIKFIKKDNSIKKIQIISKENSIKNVANFFNSYKFNLSRLIIYNQIESGNIKVIANISFDKENKKNFTYEIKGEVSEASLNILKKDNINDINFNFDIKDKIFSFGDIAFQYEKAQFQSKEVIITDLGKNFDIKGNFKSKKALVKPDSILKLLNLDLNIFDKKEIQIETDNNFSFKIDSNRSIKELRYKSNIRFDKIFINEKYQNLIFLKNGKIEVNYSNKNLHVKIDSKYSFLNEKYNIQKNENDIIINIKKNDDKDVRVETLLKNNKIKLNSREFIRYFKYDQKIFENQDIIFGNDSKIKFAINKNRKIKNLKINSILNFEKLKINYNSSRLKKIFPNYKKNIFLSSDYLEIKYSKDKTQIKGRGKYSFNDKFDDFKIYISNEKNNIKFESTTELRNNFISIDEIQYEKEKDTPARITLKGNFNNSNELKFNDIIYSEEENKILISNLNLSKDHKIKDIDKIELNFTNKNKKKNYIKLYKNKKKYKLTGDNFDGKLFVENLLKQDSNNSFLKIFENLNSQIILNLDNFFVGNLSYLNNIEGKLIVKNNKIHSGKINALLNKKNKFSLNINTTQKNEKVTNLYIDEPEPFIKNFKFIKGFSEGSLSFDSIELNGITRSKLKIYDFKVKKVPILAKLLTLASLQGIADLLTGEGIRFNELEMDYKSNKNLMTIEELYAIGPAISILMEGYIEKDKITSLRGTMVPATTINKKISKIPLLGNILVGKKLGEGVFGVSFKIKGPPKKLKTTVNPIKTLTPRFITRTVEKLKKD